MFRGIAGSSGDITAAVIYTIQFATSSQYVYGVSGVVRSSSSQRGTGQPTPFEREMREEGGLYATIDKIIPRSFEKNYIGSLLKILSNLISRGEGESNIEIFVNETCCFFSLLLLLFPSLDEIDRRIRILRRGGSPREIRSNGQSGLIKRY